MRLSDLETLAAAVQEGSLTAAARRLFLTQPAVSARLHRLEEEAGESLLHRSRRGVRTTSAGEVLYAQALRLLEEVRRLEGQLGGSGSLQGRLSVGATDLVAIYHLPAVLRRFRRRHPQVDLTVRVDGTSPLLRLLREGQAEFVLGTLPVPEEGWEQIPLYRDPLVILVPPGHRLAGGRRLDPASLGREVWISHKPESLTRQMVEAFFSARGVRLRVEMEISSPEAIKKLVQARLGLAVLPACSVRREVADGRLATVAVRGFRLERNSGLILRRGGSLGRAAAALREALAA